MHAQVDTVVFDKTGTLTEGRPVVADLATTSGGTLTPVDMLAMAAAVEEGSTHPLAAALVKERDARGLPRLAVASGSHATVCCRCAWHLIRLHTVSCPHVAPPADTASAPPRFLQHNPHTQDNPHM